MAAAEAHTHTHTGRKWPLRKGLPLGSAEFLNQDQRALKSDVSGRAPSGRGWMGPRVPAVGLVLGRVDTPRSLAHLHNEVVCVICRTALLAPCACVVCGRKFIAAVCPSVRAGRVFLALPVCSFFLLLFGSVQRVNLSTDRCYMMESNTADRVT